MSTKITQAYGLNRCILIIYSKMCMCKNCFTHTNYEYQYGIFLQLGYTHTILPFKSNFSSVGMIDIRIIKKNLGYIRETSKQKCIINFTL